MRPLSLDLRHRIIRAWQTEKGIVQTERRPDGAAFAESAADAALPGGS